MSKAVCREMKIELSQSITEMKNDLAALHQESPEEVPVIFKLVPHIDRQLCFGIILNKKSHSPLGLIFST